MRTISTARTLRIPVAAANYSFRPISARAPIAYHSIRYYSRISYLCVFDYSFSPISARTTTAYHSMQRYSGISVRCAQSHPRPFSDEP